MITKLSEIRKLPNGTIAAVIIWIRENPKKARWLWPNEVIKVIGETPYLSPIKFETEEDYTYCRLRFGI